MEKKNQNHTGAKIAAGVGIAALAAAAAGAVFLYGTDAGKKKRKQIESWSLRMKADIMDKMANMKDWSEASYHELVDTVAKKYEGLKNIDAAEVKVLVADLKKHWKTLKQHVEGKPKKSTKKKASKPAAASTETKS